MSNPTNFQLTDPKSRLRVWRSLAQVAVRFGLPTTAAHDQFDLPEQYAVGRAGAESDHRWPHRIA